MKMSQIKKNPNNPRILRDDRFEKLKRSIQEFPQMMALRPIIIDEAGIILGGNMRFEAIRALGMKEIPDEWVKRTDELTDEQKREFIIKDNVGFGDWNWDALANEWDEVQLVEWGLDLPVWEGGKEPYALVEDDGEAASSLPVNSDKYPLAIVIPRSVKNDWDDFKAAESLHTDSQAFLYLWQQHQKQAKSQATA